MSIVNEVSILKKSRGLKSEEDIMNFEESLVNILDMQNVKHIKDLCSGFVDNTEDPEVMFGLVHAIESYDQVAGMEASLTQLSEAIPAMLPHAKEWVSIIHKRILNDQTALSTYTTVVKNSATEVKEVIVKLMEEIKNEEKEEFKESVETFLTAQ